MKILGIMIREMDRMIQKNLKAGWFPFGSYEEPEEGNYVKLIEQDEQRRKEINQLLYPLVGDECPSVSISCIAGKNGSGKSTLLDILFRIINNVAYTYLVGNETTRLEYAHGVRADLHFEVDDIPGCIRCDNEESRFFWGYAEGGSCQEIKCPEKDGYKKLANFFYTISINYSMYAYNCHDYTPKDYRVSKLARGINGKWLEHVFHKNDGYLTPLVLAPFRDNNGNIDIMREKKLAIQRLTSLILLFKSQGTQFIPGYEPTRLYWRYDENYLRTAKSKLRNETGLSAQKLDRHIDYFRQSWRRFLDKEGVDIDNMQRESIEHVGKLCLSYLAYKSYKVCQTYPEFIDLFYSKPLKMETIDKIVSKLVENKDHISVKIHQCLHYIQTDVFVKNNGSIEASELMDLAKDVNSYDDMMIILPPSFFYYNLDMTKDYPSSNIKGVKIKNVTDGFPYMFPIQFGFADNFNLESMSSGERQFLHSISYALYHIKNLESIKTGTNRLHYNHVNLVLDEAELYYHPEFQRRYVQMLLESMSWCKFKKIKSINIIIVTHSPFILSDMVQDNVLYLEDGEQKKVEGYTFGANYYDLLYNSFFFEKNAIGEVATRVITDMIQKPDKYKDKKWMLDILADPIIRGHLLNKLNGDV